MRRSCVPVNRTWQSNGLDSGKIAAKVEQLLEHRLRVAALGGPCPVPRAAGRPGLPDMEQSNRRQGHDSRRYTEYCYSSAASIIWRPLAYPFFAAAESWTASLAPRNARMTYTYVRSVREASTHLYVCSIRNGNLQDAHLHW